MSKNRHKEAFTSEAEPSVIDSIELPNDIHNISSKQPFYCGSDKDKMVIRCYLPAVELGHRFSSMWLLYILLVK